MGRRKRNYIPLHQASAVVQLEQIGSRSQYQKWWDTWLPEELPRAPWRVYPDWTTWGDFLGTDQKFANANPHQYRKFDLALLYARELNIHTFSAWSELVHPDDIPRRPDIVYKGKGFMGWKHFLGQSIVHKVETARKKVASSILLVTLPRGNAANQLRITILSSLEKGKEFLGETGDEVVKGFKMESGYDWKSVVARHGHDRGNNEWLFPNVNEMLFDIDLEWLR